MAARSLFQASLGQRDFYKNCCKTTKDTPTEHLLNVDLSERRAACSLQGVVHYPVISLRSGKGTKGLMKENSCCCLFVLLGVFRISIPIVCVPFSCLLCTTQ